MTITVTNVFEAPRFDDDDGSGATTRSISENTEALQNIGAPVSATDDEGDTLAYRLAGADLTSFAIDTTTGQLKTNSALDHETKDTYHVTVWVADGKDSNGAAESPVQDDTYIDVTIEVTDVNEKPVFDSNLDTTPSIAENTTADTDIGTPLSATDEDENETLTYGLTGTDAASFDIDTATGQIKTKVDLDHEAKDTFSVTVTVSDGRNDAGDDEQTPVADATIAVTITVTDVDDDGTITLSSQQPSSGVELTATLEDDDGIKTDVAVTWVWESSTDPTDPSLWTTITDATTDSYIPQEEDEGKYLRVTATYDDELGPGKTAQAETDSAVLDMPATNELPAFDSGLTTTLSVQENTPAGENIGDSFNATDADDSLLTYSLSGTDASEFAIVETSGQIQTSTVFDYENDTLSYTITVEVRDGKDPFGNSDTRVDATIDVTINLTNMNVPAVPAAPTVAATPGAAAGLTVSWSAIAATDEAPVDGYDVQYREKDATPIADWTEVSVTTNSATITSGVVYEKTYEVQVRSRNAEGQSAWSSSGEGTIPKRLNVSFSPATRTVDEGSSASYTVTVTPAADRSLSIPVSISRGTAESGDYSPTSITLTFESSDTSKSFSVSTTNDSDRDDETVNLRFGTLPAAVGTGSQSTASLTINDTTPAPRTNTNPNPNSGGGGGGGGGGGSSTKSNSGGNSGGSYSNFQRSNVPAYVPPSNRAPSFVEGDSTHRSIAENSAGSVNIGSPVAATDWDNDDLTYYIGGMDGASFTINSGTGQLLTSSVLDFEVQQSYSIYILVSDGNGGSDRIDVTIFVIDVDETPPPVPLAQQEVPAPEPTLVPSPTPQPTEAPTPTPTLEPSPTP